jgi:hypothetical protein
MTYLKSLALGMAVAVTFLTSAQANASWPILGKAENNQRFVIVDGLKHDLAQTGDAIRIDGSEGKTEIKEVVLTIYSSGKTIFMFRSPLDNKHTAGKATVVRKDNRATAPRNLTNLGIGFSDPSFSKPIPVGSRSVWINNSLYNSLETKDQVKIVAGNLQVVKTVQHVVSYKNMTLIFFSTPFTRAMSRPVLSINNSDSDLSGLIDVINEIEQDNNTAPTPSPTPVGNVAPLLASRSDDLNNNKTLVAGIDDIMVMKFKLKNPNLTVATINHVALKYVGTDAAKTNLQDLNVAIFVNGTQQGSSQNIQTNNKPFAISNMRVPINPGQSTEFEVVVDTSEKISDTNSTSDTFRFELTGLNASFGNKLIGGVNSSTGKTLGQSSISGATLEAIQGGSLKVENASTIFSDIIVSNQVDAEILKIRLSAENDEVQIANLNFKSNYPNASAIVFFDLYDERGLLASRAMVNGILKFEFSSRNKIRVPKNGSKTLSIRAGVRDITSVAQSGKKLDLALDTTKDDKGLLAITAATGSNMSGSSITVGNIKSEEFLVTKSRLSLRHAITQPRLLGPSAQEQEVYRFTATADSAGAVGLEKVTLKLDLQGMKFSGKPDYRLMRIRDDGTLGTNNNVSQLLSSTAQAGGISDTVKFRLNSQTIAQGQSLTYALLVNKTQDNGGMDDDDAIAVNFVPDNNAAGPLPSSQMESAHNIVWSDGSANGGGTDSFNSYLLDLDFSAYLNRD